PEGDHLSGRGSRGLQRQPSPEKPVGMAVFLCPPLLRLDREQMRASRRDCQGDASGTTQEPATLTCFLAMFTCSTGRASRRTVASVLMEVRYRLWARSRARWWYSPCARVRLPAR